MKKSVSVLFLILLLASCNPDVRKGEHLFTLLPSSSTHIHFNNQLTETEQYNIIEYLYFNNGAGVAAGDINNDGLVDLYFTSNQLPDKLYLNKGDLKFEDITQNAGVAGTGDWKTGVTMADVNADGLLDIYVCGVGNYKNFHTRNQLYINNGDLTFTEKASEYGLDFSGLSTQAAFFDYDLDGDIDMYLLNHSVHTVSSYGNASLRNASDSIAGDRLYRNDSREGTTKFSNVTKRAGIFNSQIGYGLGISTCDINNDGYPDIYISNDFHENDYLYINNGNGTFSERLTEMIRHTSRSSMGNDAGDLNNDGFNDIIVLDMLPVEEKIRKSAGGEDDLDLYEFKQQMGYNKQFVRNTLQLNLDCGLFSEIGAYAGICSTDWSWSPLIFDMDNDGLKDIFISTGIYRRANDLDYISFLTGGNRYFPEKDNSSLTDKDLYDKMPVFPNCNYFYRNNGDLTFTNMSGKWGLKTASFSNGAVYADLDNDGDMDVVTNNINDKAFIYRNNSERKYGNHYLEILLRAPSPNSSAVGSRVTIYAGGQIQMKEQFTTRGFMSGSSGVVHFGLSSEAEADSLVIRWPDRSEQKMANINANQRLTIVKDDIKASPYKNELKPAKRFQSAAPEGLNFIHKEDPYNDMLQQNFLVPFSFSAEGPALAVGDLNGDKLDDLFAGGARDCTSAIFFQNKDGSFRRFDIPIRLEDNFSDDVDAVIFDADGDNDNDIYIVHGGNQLVPGNPFLTDNLLINDGNGNFARRKLPFISHNGSCVKPCDFDNDGDIDLLVCSISVPGVFGLSPASYLLENTGSGEFRDVTPLRAKGLGNAGMVSGADWLDYDLDGDMDFAIAGPWMRIKVFENISGHFAETDSVKGLENTYGWWSCLKTIDIDNDGDMDMIAGNLGLNSMLHASPSKPVELYLADFDNNGIPDPIICSYNDGISYPFSSLDELTSQIPDLKKEFRSYSDFGKKTVVDIFGSNVLEKSIHLKITLFESCLIQNNGKGNFEVIKLPAPAQFSELRDVVVLAPDEEGKTELVLAGNNNAIRPSIGIQDASYGLFLQYDAENGFIPFGSYLSGLVIKGDARKLACIMIKGKQYVVAGINNGDLQIISPGR